MVYSPMKILNCYKFSVTQKHDCKLHKGKIRIQKCMCTILSLFYLNRIENANSSCNQMADLYITVKYSLLT